VPESDPPTTKLPDDSRCPSCGKKIDAATHLEEHVRPKPGDFTVCFGCAVLLRFDQNLRPGPLDEKDLAALDNSPELCREIARLQMLIRSSQRSRARRN
jgi:hypothetical protein